MENFEYIIQLCADRTTYMLHVQWYIGDETEEHVGWRVGHMLQKITLALVNSLIRQVITW